MGGGGGEGGRDERNSLGNSHEILKINLVFILCLKCVQIGNMHETHTLTWNFFDARVCQGPEVRNWRLFLVQGVPGPRSKKLESEGETRPTEEQACLRLLVL
jgi:hypothetical protein